MNLIKFLIQQNFEPMYNFNQRKCSVIISGYPMVQEQPIQQVGPAAPEEAASSSTISSTSAKRPKFSRASTKSSAVKDSAAKDNGNEPAQKQATFIVRTSETYESASVSTNGHKLNCASKRLRDEDHRNSPPSKRPELEAGGTYSRFRISLSNTPAPTAPRTPFPGEGMMDTSSLAPVATQTENGPPEKVSNGLRDPL